MVVLKSRKGRLQQKGIYSNLIKRNELKMKWHANAICLSRFTLKLKNYQQASATGRSRIRNARLKVLQFAVNSIVLTVCTKVCSMMIVPWKTWQRSKRIRCVIELSIARHCIVQIAGCSYAVPKLWFLLDNLSVRLSVFRYMQFESKYFDSRGKNEIRITKS